MITRYWYLDKRLFAHLNIFHLLCWMFKKENFGKQIII